MNPSKHLSSSHLSVLCALCVPVLTGCLERRISITTEPPGALVWVNDVEVGRTPLDTDFVFYGDFDLRIRKDGYEPITTHKRANAPWYEIPPFDFVAMAIPVNFDTDIKWHFDLQPQESTVIGKEASEQAAIQRANELRAKLIRPEGGASSQNKSEAEPAPAQTPAEAPAEAKPEQPATEAPKNN